MAPTLSAARAAVQAVQVLKTLRHGAPPAAEQRAHLEQFPGWGAAAPLFDPQPANSWAALADELDDADPAAMKAAAAGAESGTRAPYLGDYPAWGNGSKWCGPGPPISR